MRSLCLNLRRAAFAKIEFRRKEDATPLQPPLLFNHESHSSQETFTPRHCERGGNPEIPRMTASKYLYPVDHAASKST